MKTRLFLGLCGAACLALLTLPAVAAVATDNAAQNQNSQAEARESWPPETLTGTISMVDPSQHILVIKGHDGVPFDMVIGRSTRIESGNQRLSLSALSQDLNHQVTVRFTPEGRGDIARSVNLNG
jgi:hypothetical protein